MNRHMTTAYSDKLIHKFFMDPDPRSGSGIRDPDPVFLKTGIRMFFQPNESQAEDSNVFQAKSF